MIPIQFKNDILNNANEYLCQHYEAQNGSRYSGIDGANITDVRGAAVLDVLWNSEGETITDAERWLIEDILNGHCDQYYLWEVTCMDPPQN